jgi:hypothetical protein
MSVTLITHNTYGQPASGYCTEYQAVYDTFTTKPSSAVATAQNTMVKDLVDAGIWAKFDIFYVFASHTNDNSEALINWKNPLMYNAISHDDPIFTAYEGMKGDGVGGETPAAYIEAGGVYLNQLTNYTLNNASYGIYIRIGYTATESKWVYGCTNDGNAYNMFSPVFGSTGVVYCLNSTGGGDITNSWGDARGFWVVDRPNSTSLSLYRNGSLVDSGNYSATAINSYAKPVILAVNAPAGPTVKRFCDAQISIFHEGGSLGALNSTYNTIIETYMDSNSKGIQ